VKKILILGGCGYIGSALYNNLISKKYRVDTVDLEWFGNFVNPRNIKKDYKDIPKSFLDKYDIVILLAGHSTVGMCKEDVIGSLKNNVENFVLLMKRLSKQKFIYTSTYRIYYGHKGLAKENDENNELFSIYDLTKKIADGYISFSSLEFYSLRLATVNGFSPNLRVNQVVNKLFLDGGNHKKITIFDKNTKFSVLGINDLCRSVEKIIEGPDKRGLYNLKSFDTTTGQIAQSVSKVFGKLDLKTEKSKVKSAHIQISSRKFSSAYNFKFKDSLENLISDLSKNYSKKSNLLKSH